MFQPWLGTRDAKIGMRYIGRGRKLDRSGHMAHLEVYEASKIAAQIRKQYSSSLLTGNAK